MANSKGVFVWRWNRVDEKIWKKNKEEKYFGGCLVEKGRGENDGGAYLSPQKSFLFKIERKLGGGKILYVKDKNAHVQVAHGLLQYVCLFFFFLCFCIFVFVFCMWFFFSTNDYYYLINLGDCMLFGCLSLFCFNWPSFFNKGIWVNSYKFTFFISPLFYLQPNKNERN